MKPMENRKINNHAFIDGQNLHFGTSKDIYKDGKIIYKGWKLDLKKFRQYLFDKFKVTKAFICIGYLKENEKFYQKLERIGYISIFKPTIKDHHGKPKGNIDAELVLHAAAIEFQNFDKAVIVSGDGDFYCLYEYLEKNKKLSNIIIPNQKSESSLLRKFQQYKILIEYEKEKLKI